MSTKIGTKRPDVSLRNKSKKSKENIKKSWKNEETRKKRLEGMKKNQSRKPSYGNAGKKHLEETKKTISNKLKGMFTGENHWNWKGGISSFLKIIRNCFEYRQWRSDVFTRDDYTCQECGKRGGCLEAHHLKRFIDIINDNNIQNLKEARCCEELWNINNGITLCKNCHNKTKNGNKKISI